MILCLGRTGDFIIPTANPTRVQMIIPGGPPYIPTIAPSAAPSNPLITVATSCPSSEIFPPLK